jgi:hypothetical protein
MPDKIISFKTVVNNKEAEAGFDGIEVSVKELHQRIKDLDIQANKLRQTFGVTYQQAPQYARIDRERGFALQRLIDIQEKEDVATRRSVRGLGSLGSAALAASGSISGLGTGVSVLTNALFSGVGLTAGLAAAVAGFSLLMEYIRGTNEEMKRTKESVSNLLEIQGPAGKFKIAPENLPGAITKMKADLEYYFGKTSEGTQRGEFKAPGTESTWRVLLTVLEEANTKYQQQLEYIKALTEAGYIYTEEEKKQTKEVKEREKTYKSIDNILSGGLRGTPEGGRGGGHRGKPGASSMFGDGAQAGLPGVDEKALQEMRQFSESSAQIFAQNMNTAWQSIFGEANSFFEQMISSWASMLTEKIGFGIFSMLFGGVDLFGFARGIFAGNATASKYRMGG